MLDPEKLKPQALAALVGSGWSHSRRAEAFSQASLLWPGIQQAIPDNVSQLIENFSGLMLVHRSRWFHCFPVEVVKYFELADVELLESYVGERVYPLGTSSCSYLTVTESGRIVYVDSDWLAIHTFCDFSSMLNWLFAGDVSSVEHIRQLALEERPEGFG